MLEHFQNSLQTDTKIQTKTNLLYCSMARERLINDVADVHFLTDWASLLAVLTNNADGDGIIRQIVAVVQRPSIISRCTCAYHVTLMSDIITTVPLLTTV